MPAASGATSTSPGLLHDVGKIGIDDQVLKKTGPLTPDEYRKIQSHVEIGVTILKDLKKLTTSCPASGTTTRASTASGYPDRLAGEEIPFEARILAVADSFDAMSSNRPYRKRLSLDADRRDLPQGARPAVGPDVVDALFACRTRRRGDPAEGPGREPHRRRRRRARDGPERRPVARPIYFIAL